MNIYSEKNYFLLNKIAKSFLDNKENFELIGNVTRIEIICLLLRAKNGEMSVTEITNNLFLSRPAVSHHLKILKDSTILKMRECRSTNYYSLNEDNVVWPKLIELFKNVIAAKEYLE